jgi:hypothetical protein
MALACSLVILWLGKLVRATVAVNPGKERVRFGGVWNTDFGMLALEPATCLFR